MPLDLVRGIPLKVCPSCSYAIEDCKITVHIEVCPLCLRKGKTVTLIERLNTINGLIKPLKERLAPYGGPQ